jgi:sulfide:quinone oxidoreductase
MKTTVAIIGSGFAALAAARKMRKLDKDVRIVMVAPVAEFIYLPSLIWMPSGVRKAADLRVNLDNFLTRNAVEFIRGTATGLKEGGRIVLTDGGEIRNDGLIIACGGRFIRKLPGIEHTITPCEGIAAGQAIHDRLKSLESGALAMGFAGNPKEPAAMRGGPMFEFLFGIDRQLRLEKRRDKFSLTFFCPSPRPGNRLGEKAVDKLLERMQARDINIHIGHKLKGFTAGKVLTEGGEIISDMTLFMPGLTGNGWFAEARLPLSEGGLIRGNHLCQVEGMNRVYVTGDAGSFPGPGWMPKQAHMAELQARAAAENLLTELHDGVANRRFKVELICIIDSINKGSLVFRNEHFSLMLPKMRALHWCKRCFEVLHMRQYR